MTRTNVNAAALPLEAYGSRGTMWWGLMGLIVVESVTFALLIACYLFYRSRYVEWPPGRLPQLGAGLVNLILIVGCCYPLRVIEKMAPHWSPKRLARWLAASAALMLLITLVRTLEFAELGTWYGFDSYGSIVWAIVFTHTIEIVLTVGETAMLAFYSASNDLDVKHRADIQLNSFFYYFLAVAWVILFSVIHLGARLL